MNLEIKPSPLDKWDTENNAFKKSHLQYYNSKTQVFDLGWCSFHVYNLLEIDSGKILYSTAVLSSDCCRGPLVSRQDPDVGFRVDCSECGLESYYTHPSSSVGMFTVVLTQTGGPDGDSIEQMFDKSFYMVHNGFLSNRIEALEKPFKTLDLWWSLEELRDHIVS